MQATVNRPRLDRRELIELEAGPSSESFDLVEDCTFLDKFDMVEFAGKVTQPHNGE